MLKDYRFSGDKENPEDQLVVPSHPEGQVNVEILRTCVCKSAGQIGEWTAAPIDRKNYALNQHNPREDRRAQKLVLQAGPRNCQDAPGHNGPNQRVNNFHSNQLAGLC